MLSSQDLLWRAKGTGSCSEEVFPTQAGAAIPKLPSFTVQSRPAFDIKVETVIGRSRSDLAEQLPLCQGSVHAG